MYRNSYMPQNAIQQSSEFVDLGKRESALEILFEAIRARRGKTWSPSLEEAMSNFLKLCISLRSAQGFKDGANQFRILCQMTNVNSFESTINKFFDSCLDASNKAKNESIEKVLAEDLDEIETPETIILKSISETTHQDRTDRILLTPTLKFTWEAFRNILEICKNNRNLERFYADICKKVFKFLLKFERKMEFRKLCDVSKLHLQQTVRYTQNTLSINLSDPASIELQLEIRLGQLETAISMELWNEAFKTMEDIHFILRMSKKPPHPKILAIFYQKISLVFSKANAPLYHAVALQKLFILIKEHKKGFKLEELTKISSKVLAATISVPLAIDQTNIDSLTYQSNDSSSSGMQLSSILGLNGIPTRTAIIDDIPKISILEYADSSLVNIYKAFQGSHTYKNLCEYVSEQLSAIPDFLVDDIANYISSIRKISFCILVKRLSSFYRCITLDRLVKYSIFYHTEEVLAHILEFNRLGLIYFSYNDELGMVNFCQKSSVISNSSNLVNNRILGEFICSVSKIYTDIRQSITENELKIMIHEYKNRSFVESNRYRKINEDIIVYLEKVSKQNEEMDKQMAAKMEEERTRMELIQTQRMEEERKERDEKRQLQKLKENQILYTLEQVNELSNSDVSKKLIKDINTMDFSKNPTKYLDVQNELRDKEISMNVKKIKKIEKMMDTYVFVMHLTLKSQIDAFLSNYLMQEKQAWQLREDERIKASERHKNSESDIRKRLILASDDIDLFIKSSEEKTKSNHEKALKEYNELIAKERELVYTKKKAEYLQKRKEEHVAKLKQEFLQKHKIDTNKTIKTSSQIVTLPKSTNKLTTPVTTDPNKYVPVKKNVNYFSDKKTSTSELPGNPSTAKKRVDYGFNTRK
ncbi:hypothetical protein HZS_2950 [Henneguya salminicola]|nr:hypothetical protein HZS_2950 [Henneguya salminicola]